MQERTTSDTQRRVRRISYLACGSSIARNGLFAKYLKRRVLEGGCVLGTIFELGTSKTRPEWRVDLWLG
jgi:hypothetical protein